MVERVNLNFSGFRPDIIEKVIRLLLILERIGNHAFLGSRMSLHGGTALNLFVLAMPRLSVDIDLSYVGNTDREQMLAERPAIEHAIADIARELGFTVTISPAEHSGRTFRLQYKGTAGLDSVKIDTNFLNRSPLLPLQRKTVVLDSGAEVTFPLNSDIELIAGKLKALVERVAVRDLYDTSRIAAIYPDLVAGGDERLFRRIVLYYLAKSEPFPRLLEVGDRFSGRHKDVADTLYPMLLAGEEPHLEAMIDTAQAFLARVSRPVDTEDMPRSTPSIWSGKNPPCTNLSWPPTPSTSSPLSISSSRTPKSSSHMRRERRSNACTRRRFVRQCWTPTPASAPSAGSAMPPYWMLLTSSLMPTAARRTSETVCLCARCTTPPTTSISSGSPRI